MKPHNKNCFQIIVSLALSLSVAFAEKTTIHPLRVSSAPSIDGKLDDSVWKEAPLVTSFRTFIPDFGKAMPESTVVWSAYDDENLYFAFRSFDPHPELIKAEMTSRDNIRPNDWVCINLDSFNDQQSLYCLYVNPYGIQSDSRFAANAEDFSVDLVWYSAGTIDPEGYSVEVRVPLKSLRYANTNPVTMSIFFERFVSRRGEHASFPEMDPKQGYQFLSEMSPIVYPDVKHFALVEVLPAYTHTERYKSQQGALAKDASQGELSLTGKYGITSDLILDATYNPDFSQVEADAGQVDINLRSPLFFAEKRPFFLEGSEIFNLSAADWVSNAVYTRAVVNPSLGIKLSGKLDKANTVALIYAQDELARENPLRLGTSAKIPLVRYKHALSDDSFIGGFYSGRELNTSFNRAVGADGTIRVSQSGVVEFNTFFSSTRTTDVSDPVDGNSFAGFYRHNTRDLDMRIGVSRVTQDFAAEAGFVGRTGVLSAGGYASPKFYPTDGPVRRYDVILTIFPTRDDASGLWETLSQLTVRAIFTNSQNVQLRGKYSTEVYNGQRFETSDVAISGGGPFSRQINANFSYRMGKAILFTTTEQGYTSRATASVVYQPWSQLEFNGSATYQDFYRDSDGQKISEVPIFRLKTTYQFNQYLFLRGIGEYNKFRRTFTSDFLASFTYIPGTVVYLGYGSLYERKRWDTTTNGYTADEDFLETTRGFFMKLSYLWRL